MKKYHPAPFAISAFFAVKSSSAPRPQTLSQTLNPEP
jgi:hypothetical protein